MPISSSPKGELMSSINAVRELLKKDFSSEGQHALADELSSVQQARYQDRLKHQTELDVQKEIIEDLKNKLVRVKQEAEQEKRIRKSLEETNEALEQHKQELASKLEYVATTEQELANESARASVEKHHTNLIKEKEKLSESLLEAQKEKEEAARASMRWEALCVATQRQVKALQVELDTSKKESKVQDDRHSKLLERHASTYDSFNKRLEESANARAKAEERLKAYAAKTGLETTSEALPTDIGQKMSSLESRLKEAIQAKTKAQEKAVILETQLESLRRGRSLAFLKKESEMKEKSKKKVQSLNVSLDKMKKQADAVKEELGELAKGATKAAAEKLKKKKETFVLETAKVGAVLESLETQLKDQLTVQKQKVEDTEAELKRVQETLSDSQSAVNATTEEIEKLKTKMNEPAKKETQKKGQKKRVATTRAKGPAKKKQDTDADEPAKRRRRGK